MSLARHHRRPLHASRLGFVLSVVLLATNAASAQSFNMSDFFTPSLDDYWTYRLNGAQFVTTEVSELVPAGGFIATTSRWIGGPLDGVEGRGRFNPSVGVELLSTFQPSVFIDGVGFVDLRQDFSPPILAAPAVVTIGDVVQSTGALTQTLSNASASVPLFGTYATTYRFAFLEPIHVPFGVFHAIQRQIQIDIALEIAPGQWEEVRATSRDWLVPGLGSVRIEQTFPDRTDIYELVDTNRVLVPEPRSILQGIASAACVLVLRFRRGSRTHFGGPAGSRKGKRRLPDVSGRLYPSPDFRARLSMERETGFEPATLSLGKGKKDVK